MTLKTPIPMTEVDSGSGISGLRNTERYSEKSGYYDFVFFVVMPRELGCFYIACCVLHFLI